MKKLLISAVTIFGFFTKTQAQIQLPKTPETKIKFSFQVTKTDLAPDALSFHSLTLWAAEIYFETEGSHHHIGIRPDGELYFINGVFVGSKADIYTYLSFNPFSKSKFFSLGVEREFLPSSVFFLEINKEIDSNWGLSLGVVYFIQPQKIFKKHS